MPTVLQLRRGTTAEHSSFTGAEGEVTINTTKDTLVVHDGATQGGFELALADLSNTTATTYADFSVTDSGGDGSLSYDNTTGTFTYTGSSAAEVRAHITAGTGVSISSGEVAIGQAIGTSDSPTFAGLTLTGNQEITGNIVPSADVTYDLGSSLKQWRDIYVGPGSLYVNGQQVVSDNSGTITISADSNQDVAVQTSGSGDISLDPTGSGIVQIKSTLQIEDGNNITNSAGNAIAFGSGLKADSVTANSADTSLTLAGNGTGTVAIADNTAITGTLSTTGDADIGGDLTITGNLQVDGTTTTINSTALSVDDLNITVASGAANAAAANGAGITVDGASATMTYVSAGDNWSFNKPLKVTGDVTVTGAVVPSANETYDLGSSSLRWRDLYLSGNTLDLGGTTMSVSSGAFEMADMNVTGTLTYGTLNDGTAALTATVAELNKLGGVTATTVEINKLDGVTATTTELNYVDGVTSNIQTQINANRINVYNSAGTLLN